MSDLEQELEKLKKENKKLSLESKLRKSMAVELDRQKELLRQATEEVEAQKEKIEGISLKLSRYLPVQLYEQIFSGSLDIHKKSERKKLTIFFSDIVGLHVDLRADRGGGDQRIFEFLPHGDECDHGKIRRDHR